MVWLLSSAGWHITSNQSIAAILPRLETRLPALADYIPSCPPSTTLFMMIVFFIVNKPCYSSKCLRHTSRFCNLMVRFQGTKECLGDIQVLSHWIHKTTGSLFRMLPANVEFPCYQSCQHGHVALDFQ